MSEARRLFHAVVVLGAALGGCSSDEQPAVDGSGGAAGGDGDSGGGGEGGSGGASLNVGGSCPSSATSADECGAPADFFCEPCDTALAFSCHCEASAPDDASACSKPEDFHCQSYDPMIGCSCVEGSPASQEDCLRGQFHCAVDDPPIGCDCIVTITAPHPQ